jgi:hypothetical protein
MLARVDPQGGRPQGPPPLIHVLPRPYGIKLLVQGGVALAESFNSCVGVQ